MPVLNTKRKSRKCSRPHGWSVEDKGTYSTDSVDYPDFAHPVATMVEENKAAAGILVCGSGNGVVYDVQISTWAFVPPSAGPRNWQCLRAHTTMLMCFVFPRASCN